MRLNKKTDKFQKRGLQNKPLKSDGKKWEKPRVREKLEVRKVVKITEDYRL